MSNDDARTANTDGLQDARVQTEAWPQAPTAPEYIANAGAARQRFVPATRAARAAIGGIVVSLGFHLIVGILSGILFVCIRERHISRAVVALYRNSWTVETLCTLAYFVAGVLFLRWFYLSYRNLPSLGTEKLFYTPVWTIVWFFVPFLGLYKPYRMMVTTWRASEWTSDKNDAVRRAASDPPLIAVWWVTWILGEVVREIGGYTSEGATTWSDAAIVESVLTAAGVLLILAGILLIKIIRQIDSRQLVTARRIAENASTV